MRHIQRESYGAPNTERRMLCGIGPELPEGDDLVYEGDVGLHHTVDCPGCNGGREGPRPLGTPLSELSGTQGEPGYERFKAIAASWGYD